MPSNYDQPLETLTQQRVDYVCAKYSESGQSTTVFPENLLQLLDTDKICCSSTSQPSLDQADVYLASTSKVLTVFALLKNLIGEQNREEDLARKKVEINFEVVKELIGEDDKKGRGVERVLAAICEDYPAFRGIREQSPGLVEAYQPLRDTVLTWLEENRPDLHRSIVSAHSSIKTTKKYVDVWENALRSIPDNVHKNLNFEISAKEFAYLTLGLSCNSTQATARRIIQNKYSGQFGVVNEEAIRKMYRVYAPSFCHTHSSENNAHWIQSDANIGKLSELSEFLETLYRSANSGDYIAQLSLESISRGHLVAGGKGFGHDFATTPLAKALRAQGYKIYEKTGYYPTVFWVEDLADIGPHMSLTSIILVESPKGQVQSFSFSWNIPLPVVSESVVEDRIHFPAYERKPYKDKVKLVFKLAGKEFRAEMEEIIRANLLHERES